MKLYYSKGACSLAVRINLHEMEIHCAFESVDLKTKKTETGADFLKINPKGAVPTLMLENGQILTENAVIQQYLADHYKNSSMLPHIGDFKRYRVLEWLNFINSDLHKSVAVYFNPNMPDEIREKVYRPLIEKHLNYLDQHLANHPYLVEDHPTLPDAYLFVVLRWVQGIKYDLAKWKNLSRYFDEMKQRKAVQQALKEEGLS